MPATRRRAPLAGRRIAIARPVGRHRALVARLSREGASAVVLPVASLAPPHDPAVAARALAAARRAAVIVFTSPTAVAYAFRLAPGWRPARGARVYAIGPSSARALARRGVTAALPAGRYDSEGLLARPELATGAGRALALVTAPDGRGLLPEALGERGFDVTEVHVYRRRLPRWSARHHERLARAPDALLVSSAEAVTALAALAGATGFARLASARWIASSARVAEAARRAGVARVVVARSALAADLVAAARDALA